MKQKNVSKNFEETMETNSKAIIVYDNGRGEIF